MKFTEKDLSLLVEELKELGDEKYKKFNDSLIPGISETSFGVRIPETRKIAKRILKSDWYGFLKLTCRSNIYEIRLLRGLVTAGAPCSLDERFDLLRDFIPEINNWAVCDCVSGELKYFAKNKEKAHDFLLPYLDSEDEFEVRFACVTLMRWFTDSEHIRELLTLYERVKHEGYYVKMAVAWGVSVCLVKFRDETLEWLKNCTLDDFTFNKSLQKAIESYRTAPEDKELLRKMKR